MVDWDLVRKLIQVIKEEDISGLAVEENGVKYEVHRNANGTIMTNFPPVPPPTSAAASASTPTESEEEGVAAITSPMVGTFYRASSPESPVFVEPGHEVEPGKIVCIVEAMKLFNEIESEIKGKVIKILVENGQPVEYGQKLILIKKA